MNSEKVNSWLSLGANIGVVIGLFLVAYQINQDAALTRAQLFSDHTDSRREWNQSMMGDQPMEIVAKSIQSPHDLTLADLHAMDMYLIGALNEMRRLEVLKAAGLDVGMDVEGFHYFYFGSQFAKSWFQEYGAGTAETRSIQDDIENVPEDWIVSFFGRVLGNLDESAGQSVDRAN